jgi:hypothetical protein
MNMSTHHALRAKPCLQLAAVAAVAALTVLGSDNSSAGIQGSGRSFAAIGRVDGVGRGIITVGDTTYSTTGNTTFRIDGSSGKKSQLRNGDVVSLWGTVSARGEPIAEQVLFNGNVQGTVSGVDTQSGSFVVLQQTVVVHPDTTFGDGIATASLSGLRDGQFVEVSAFEDSKGDLIATRVDVRAADSPAQIVGSVQRLNSKQLRFRINSLTIDYRSAEVDGVLADGKVVVARGAQPASDGTLVAKQVEVLPAAGGPPGTEGHIDGIITSFSSNTYFSVGGQPVATSADTKLLLKEPLGLDVAVKVTGTFDANGVLIASKVKSYK